MAQPPVKRMDIVKEDWQTGSSEAKGKLLTHRGLKMGVLYDFAEEEAHSGSHLDSTSFDIEWHMFAAPEEEAASFALVQADMSPFTRDRKRATSRCI